MKSWAYSSQGGWTQWQFMSVPKMTDKERSTFPETLSFLETQSYNPAMKRKKKKKNKQELTSGYFSLLKVQIISCIYTLEVHLFHVARHVTLIHPLTQKCRSFGIIVNKMLFAVSVFLF